MLTFVDTTTLSDALSAILDNSRWLWPEVALVIGLVVVLLWDLAVKRKSVVVFMSLAGVSLLVAIFFLVEQWVVLDSAAPEAIFSEMLLPDRRSVFFRILFCVGGLLTLLLSIRYRSGSLRVGFERVGKIGEYYVVILGLLIGALLMSMAVHLLAIYVALETVSLCSYVLTNFNFERKSAEASIKYLLFGGVASAVMLYGMSWLYGLSGTLVITSPAMIGALHDAPPLLAGLAVLMTLGGFLFKISAVPFHLWAPDVYEGAPTPVVALFSVVPKLAGLVLLIRFVPVLQYFSGAWDGTVLLAGLAMVTMTVGNVAALGQTNAKRMMAYSSIAHSGFLLVGVVAYTAFGLQSVLFYAAVYLLMNFAAFLLIQLLSKRAGQEHIPDFRGRGRQHPGLGVAVLLVMIALTGLPPTAGFTAKVLIFSSLWEAYQQQPQPLLLVLFVVGLVNTAVALFYYLKIPFYMFFREAEVVPSSATREESRNIFDEILVGLLIFLLLVLFFKPELLLTFIALAR